MKGSPYYYVLLCIIMIKNFKNLSPFLLGDIGGIQFSETFFNFKRLVGSAFPKLKKGEVVKTKISPLLKPLNKDVGLVVLGWGTTPLMVVILILFLIFLVLLVAIYNSSLNLEGLDVDWEEFI